MKCATHPEREVVGSCTACKRDLCETCRVMYMGMPHCTTCAGMMKKQLISTGRTPLIPIIPKGRPKKEFFIFGGIGALINTIAAFLVGYYLLYLIHRVGFAQDIIWFYLVVILFSFGLALIGVGCYGFHWNYGAYEGLTSCVFMIIASVLFPAAVIFGVRERDHGYTFELIYALGSVILGVALLQLGSMFLKSSDSPVSPPVTGPAGTFVQIVGVLFVIVFPALFFGLVYFISIAAFILAGLTFFRMQPPPGYPVGSPPTQDISRKNDNGENGQAFRDGIK